MGGGCRGRSLRASLVAVLFASLVWFLFIGILANQDSENSASRRISSARNLNIFSLIANTRHYLPGTPNFNSVSKRRVPNGPDPIHNRRTGNCRVPPTRA